MCLIGTIESLVPAKTRIGVKSSEKGTGGSYATVIDNTDLSVWS